MFSVTVLGGCSLDLEVDPSARNSAKVFSNLSSYDLPHPCHRMNR